MATISKASCRLALASNATSAAQRTHVAANQPKAAASYQKKAFLTGTAKITPARVTTRAAIRRGVFAGFEDQDPTAKPTVPTGMPTKEEYEKAMADPETRAEVERLQQTMANPQVAKQMEAMGSFMKVS